MAFDSFEDTRGEMNGESSGVSLIFSGFMKPEKEMVSSRFGINR